MERQKPERGCSQGRGARHERSAARRALILDGSPSGGYDRHNQLHSGALLYCVPFWILVEIPHVSPDGSCIHICQKAWRGEMHDFLKTRNGEREIDLHPLVVKVLREFIGERKSGLLFRTRTGQQLHQSNILRRVLHPILEEML